MTTADLQEPSQPASAAAVSAEVLALRGHTITLHNSRIGCGIMLILSVSALFIGICMVFMVISLLFPVNLISFVRVIAAAQWGLGAITMMYMCPALWKWTMAMAHKRVKLDARGADFTLGTKKKPVGVFLSWESIVSVVQSRTANTRQFTVTANDGSYAQFTSATFFRAKHVARLIAERAGVTTQKS